MAEMKKDKQGFRSGFVGMAGAPNVGKSTLVNALLGTKVTIVSRRPQTTRHRVSGILTNESMQAVLMDLPGIPTKKDKSTQPMAECAEFNLGRCDLILHVQSSDTTAAEWKSGVKTLLNSMEKPIWRVWNKIDLLSRKEKEALKGLGSAISSPVDGDSLHYETTHFVSAKTGQGLDQLKKSLAERLPVGPMLYPEDDLSDRNLRFLSAEIVREKIFDHLHDEIPYGVETWTEEWEERAGGMLYLRVIIQTGRSAHKQILIGKGGEMVKRIGAEARPDIEALCDASVYLDLKVKVAPR